MLEITQLPDTEEVHVLVVGEIEGHNGEGFRQRLLGAVTDSTTNVTVDVSQLNYINSWGLAVLVEFGTRLMRTGGKLRILNPTTMLRRLLKETRMDQIFCIVSDVSDECGAQAP